MRGMEWVGRRVFGRGYWKSGEEKKAEMEVLLPVDDCGEGTDGTIEDDIEEVEKKSGVRCELVRRWVRVVWCAVSISDTVEGFGWVEGSREWRVEGALKEKVQEWREAEREERGEEERTRTWVEDAMNIDDEEASISEESEEGGKDDSEENRNLRVRRSLSKSLLQIPQCPPQSQRQRQNAPKKSTASSDSHLTITPGYSIPVFDTTCSSPRFHSSSLIESHQLTNAIPLITKHDRLASPVNANQPQLPEAAQAALAYISSHLRSHALSLKVQMSWGNYLTSLGIQTEELDFAFSSGGVENKGRNMDDLILKTAVWQDEQWVSPGQEEGQSLLGTKALY